MITRRGFIASCIAAVPVLGLVLTRERDTRAQARPDTANPIETIRPQWKKDGDSMVTPDRVQYIGYAYVAQRRIRLPRRERLTDRDLRALGFWPVNSYQTLPLEAVGRVGNRARSIWNKGDTLLVVARVDE